MNRSVIFLSAISLFFYQCGGTEGSETEQNNDSTMVETLSFPEKAASMTIYEVNIRQHTAEGTIDAFIKDMPRIKELGTEILWLMPIQPIGEEKRKGELGSYYSIKDYTDINAEFGNLDDFKRLVTEAHDLGLYVILDWVPNHTAWDHPWIEEHPEYYAKDSLGNITYEADWTDIALLDHTNPETRKAMTEKMRWWVEETDIDGFRCDHAAHEIPMTFWEETIPALNEIKDLFWLAEWDDIKLHPLFHASYSWEMHHLTNSVAKGDKSPDILIDHIISDNAKFGDAFRLMFTTNHDENAWNGTVFERYGEAHKAFAVFTFTSTGIPMIYSGQEAGLDERLEFFKKDTISWEDPLNLEAFYTSLIDLRKENKALWTAPFGAETKFREDDNNAVIAYTRSLDENAITVVINFSSEPQTVGIIGIEQAEYTEYFTGESVSTQGKLEMVPNGYKVLVHKQTVTE